MTKRLADNFGANLFFIRLTMRRMQKAAGTAETQTHTWKKRPSEIRGYQRAFYLTTDKGDYIRVDYHIKDKRVRLYLEIASEGGSPYYSVISEGKITAEKSVSTGRSFGFTGKFQGFADIFNTIPSRDVIKLISKNYGIGVTEEEKNKKQKRLDEIKKKYFKEDTGEGESERITVESFRIIGNAQLVDLIDVLIGISISAALFFFFQRSFLAFGVVSSFFGIIIGFVDIFFRGRSPLFMKVIFFILIGSASYIFGYYYS